MPPKVREGNFYTIAEAARALDVSRSTVWRWIDRGKLTAYRLGPKSIRIKRTDVDAMLQPDLPEQKRVGQGRGDWPFSPPSPEELTRRKALVAQILTRRKHRVIAPLTTADLVRMAREEEVFYGAHT